MKNSKMVVEIFFKRTQPCTAATNEITPKKSFSRPSRSELSNSIINMEHVLEAENK